MYHGYTRVKKKRNRADTDAVGDEASAAGLPVEEPAAQSCSSCHTQNVVWGGNPGL